MSNASAAVLTEIQERASFSQKADALFDAGHVREAQQLYERAVAEGFATETTFFRLAAITDGEGRHQQAIEWLSRAVMLNPDNAEYHYTLGRLHKARKQLDLAELAYRAALRLQPDYVDAWISLGILLRNAARPKEAEDCYREALRLDAANFRAVLGLGNAFLSQDRAEAAVESFRQAVRLNARSAEANNSLGRALLKLGDGDAAQYFERALGLDPKHFDAAEGLGRCLFEAGMFEGAITALTIASRLRPDSIEVGLSLANAYAAAGKFGPAEQAYAQLLRDHPGLPLALAGLASLLSTRGQYSKPRSLYEEALAREPDNHAIRVSFGLLLLRSSQFDTAWAYYESRKESGEDKRSLQQPKWQGEDLAGKTLLILCEQGLGDEIMFASMFSDVIPQAGHCIIECDERLAALFRRAYPNVTVFGVNRKEKYWHRTLEKNLERLPAFDYWVAAGSLPSRFRNGVERFPMHSGYLQADAARVRKWKEKLAELGPGMKVGISWRGGTARTRTAMRSLQLDHLGPILTTKGVHFVNLQYGDCMEEIRACERSLGIEIHHWPEAIDDYEETAALVASVDLMISVCTAAVHLGGALGKPVWVLAPHVAEWRYGRNSESMIWYPSVRMFRQPKAEEWRPVVSDVRRALGKCLQAFNPPVA